VTRDGRKPGVREGRWLRALEWLHAGGHDELAVAAALAQDYRFLRRLENRLELLRDEQTHLLPSAPLGRERIARGLGHDGWDRLARDIARHRARVTREFEALLSQREQQPAVAGDIAGYWRALDRKSVV